MSRFFRLLPLHSQALPAAIGSGLAMLFMAVLLLTGPGGLGALLRHAPICMTVLLGLPVTLTLGSAGIGPRQRARPVPVRAGIRRLPR